jgi:hypothetical protein
MVLPIIFIDKSLLVRALILFHKFLNAIKAVSGHDLGVLQTAAGWIRVQELDGSSLVLNSRPSNP